MKVPILIDLREPIKKLRVSLVARCASDEPQFLLALTFQQNPRASIPNFAKASSPPPEEEVSLFKNTLSSPRLSITSLDSESFTKLIKLRESLLVGSRSNFA
ncbi:hypothetical protein Rs2_52489 [Raphanus sativus]|nr:hypothetical protein Rs2_52489 [Raphanus sativus]